MRRDKFKEGTVLRRDKADERADEERGGLRRDRADDEHG